MAQKTRVDAKWSTLQKFCNNRFKWMLKNQLNPYFGQQCYNNLVGELIYCKIGRVIAPAAPTEEIGLLKRENEELRLRNRLLALKVGARIRGCSRTNLSCLRVITRDKTIPTYCAVSPPGWNSTARSASSSS
jgi:hypothetical protein